MKRIRITVVERTANVPLVEAFMGDEVKAKRLADPKCDHCADGQVFIVDDLAAIPEGFCASAWSDIYKQVLAIWAGGDKRPWVRFPATAIACCTDAYRPVVFKLERIETE